MTALHHPGAGRAAAVVAAAGRGERMGAPGAKAFLPLAGTPLVVHAVRALNAASSIDRIIVVVQSPDVPRAQQLLSADPRCAKVDTVIAGGDDRQASVLSGLTAAGTASVVAVHDGARPLVTPGVVDAVIAAARESGAASAGVPVRQTVKLVEQGRAIETLDRDRLWLAHTPQAFDTGLLKRAHDQALRDGIRASDDASLVERTGHPVRMVEDLTSNVKITVSEDLILAEAYLGASSERGRARTGMGFDVHRLVPGRRLVLGGVTIDGPRGLAGHSDADVLTHAVMDALLGAAGLGDIGARFPPDDPAYRDADSIGLLQDVTAAVAAAGFAIRHVDSTILADVPRLAPHLDGMRRRLAAAMGIGSDAVNVKATTMEGLGPIGRGEGIAAQAVATLART